MAYTNATLTDHIARLQATLASAPPPLDPAPTLPSDPRSLAKLIDHTLLAPASTLAQIRHVCTEAKHLGTATVCVNSSLISAVADELAGSAVQPIAVVGFPFGAANTEGKVQETRTAVQQGAVEIDMVQNIGLLKSGEYAAVLDDIRAVVAAAAGSGAGAIVKVIVETALLTRNELVAATYLACLAGAAFVKTSTGYGGAGARAEDVRLMHAIANTEGLGWSHTPLIKASGGIRSLETVALMVRSGASRVGASGTKAILDEAGGAAVERSEASGGY